jgi:anti-sigma regulatory factor (Ser/Thr protein kinase)
MEREFRLLEQRLAKKPGICHCEHPMVAWVGRQEEAGIGILSGAPRVDESAEVRIVSQETAGSKVITMVKRSLLEPLAEHEVWDEYFDANLKWLPEDVQRICHYGFTEMLNNAIDHSEGTSVLCWATYERHTIELVVADDGIGIFEKLKTHFNLDDHRHAILELCKGKLTTDRRKHTGEGIFFTSRMFDEFVMRSNHLGFVKLADSDWLVEVEEKQDPGTCVAMKITVESKRTTKEVFDMFADPSTGDFTFSKTHVPLVLARDGKNQLISRSEAKRVLARFEGFTEVLLDFSGIEEIGPAFADEIFRVFRLANPNVKVVAMNLTQQVQQMISRVMAGERKG